MRILCVADARPLELDNKTFGELVREQRADVVVLAGDLADYCVTGVSDCGVPVLGVYGNHCDGKYLEQCGATNLHLSHVTVGGVSFTGLQGCVQYSGEWRGGGHWCYTQDEYEDLVADLPPADVLVTHCPPAGINDGEDHAHRGIRALVPWLRVHRPSLMIHGHTYPSPPVTDLSRIGLPKSRVHYTYGASAAVIDCRERPSAALSGPRRELFEPEVIA